VIRARPKKNNGSRRPSFRPQSVGSWISRSQD